MPDEVRPTQITDTQGREFMERARRQDATDTVRIYVQDWIRVFTNEEDSENCYEYFAGKYEGRIRDEDMRIQQSVIDNWVLEIRVWNLFAETKNMEMAEALGETAKVEGFEEVRIVYRSSRDETKLKDYGRVKIKEKS